VGRHDPAPRAPRKYISSMLTVTPWNLTVFYILGMRIDSEDPVKRFGLQWGRHHSASL